ncbi:MAG: arylesterase [Sphingomonadales bacterium]
MKNIVLLAIWVISVIAAPLQAGEAGRTVVVFGDSLAAGFNLPPGASFPAQLEVWLRAEGNRVTVINAGVSGDTSAGGIARMDWVLSSLPGGKADLVIVEFGGNDMLRGFEPSITRTNIAAMLELLNARQIPSLLAGMKAPPNMGREYEEEFNRLFPELAKEYGSHFYPFFLEGVAARPELNLSDGIHPNEKGIRLIVERMGPFVLEALEQK